MYYDFFISGCTVPSQSNSRACGGHQLFNPSPPLRSISHQIRRMQDDSRKSTQRGEKRLIGTHSPAVFFPHTALLLVDQGPPLNPPNHGRCETGKRFLVRLSPATGKVALSTNRMLSCLDPGGTGAHEWVNGREWRGVAVQPHGIRFAAELERFVAGRSEDLDVWCAISGSWRLAGKE
jgi:hypothetical protein